MDDYLIERDNLDPIENNDSNNDKPRITLAQEDNDDKIFYILPYNTKNETPNMLVVSHNYYVKTHGLDKPRIDRNSRTYLRVVYMKDEQIIVLI